MRILTLLIGTAALFAATAPAAGASRADCDACKGADGARWVVHCTPVVEGRGEIANDCAIAHYERGLAYKSKGDFGRAIADFTEAIRLDPKYAEAYYNRAGAYGNKGDLDRAIADLSEAIRLAPAVAAAHHDRGQFYRMQGNYERAIADLSQASQIDAKSATTFNQRG